MKNKDFLDIFDSTLFLPGLEARAKHEALERLVDFLHSRKRINSRQGVLNTLLEREKLGSTGLEKGVAIPHSRSMMVERMTVLFASVPKGVDFDARDRKPVHLVFLILAPPLDVGNQYLPFLGKLVEVLREKKQRDALRSVDTFESFLSVMEKGLTVPAR